MSLCRARPPSPEAPSRSVGALTHLFPPVAQGALCSSLPVEAGTPQGQGQAGLSSTCLFSITAFFCGGRLGPAFLLKKGRQ